MSLNTIITSFPGVRSLRAWMPSRCQGHHGYQPRQPRSHDPFVDNDVEALGVSTPRSRPIANSLSGFLSLDNLANNIASATFDVINSGKVRTADMGGEYLISSYLNGHSSHVSYRLCNHLGVHQRCHQKH